MTFSLATLWHERSRFLPGVLAVAFSCLLIAVQFGLLLGLLSLTSIPVDLADADVWVGYPGVLSVDLGRPIPERWLTRVQAEPGVTRVEKYLLALLMVDKPGGRSNICAVIGTRTDDDSLGVVREMSPELRARLSEPGAVVVDESDMQRLCFDQVGDCVEVMGRRARLVGVMHGVKSLAAPYIFCSVETAHELIPFLAQRDQTTYLLAKCDSQAVANRVASRLRKQYGDMSAYTKAEFSDRTRWYWLMATKSGIAIGGSAVLGLFVGAVVTSQTLFAAVAASLKEYATLRALGIPRWRIAGTVMAQSFWVGAAGVALALPAAYALGRLVEWLGARALLPPWLMVGAALVTIGMAMVSGLAALRSLRLIEPAQLLR